MVRELLGGAEARATRVVAFGNSRLPTYSGPRAELLEARQAPMEALASARRSELVGFDSLFIHVGTQVRKPVCVADDPRPALCTPCSLTQRHPYPERQGGSQHAPNLKLLAHNEVALLVGWNMIAED